jgi:hypothetical protein
MMTRALLALLVLGATAAPRQAEAASVNRREHRQVGRIGEGVRSGDLTRKEARRLAAQQAHLRKEEWRYRHDDGQLGPRERLDLQRDMKRASRSIYNQKHDGQERP